MWIIQVYNAKTKESGYLSGDIHNTFVARDCAWQISTCEKAANIAFQYISCNPSYGDNLWYRLEPL